jgi:hypothetical protein
MIRHFDHQIAQLEEELQRQAKKLAARDYALLQTVPGIGENLGMTILCEIGDSARFPTVKNFLSYSRRVKGTVASAGKIKGRRGAKLGNPYLRWAREDSGALIGRARQRSHPRGGRPPGDASWWARRRPRLAYRAKNIPRERINYFAAAAPHARPQKTGAGAFPKARPGSRLQLEWFSNVFGG